MKRRGEERSIEVRERQRDVVRSGNRGQEEG